MADIRFSNTINTILCPIKVGSNTIELRVRTSCYFVLDLLCYSVWSFPSLLVPAEPAVKII